MPDNINGNSTYEDMLNLMDFHMPTPPEYTSTGNPSVNIGIGMSAGIGGTKEVDPALAYEQLQAKINGVNSPVLTPSSVVPVSPSQIDTSGRYPFQRVGENNEELYAEGQSAPSKMINAVGKGVGLGVGTFLQSTLGSIIGVGAAIADQRLASFYDNPFNRAIDDKIKRLENQLPNYYTQAEKDAKWYSNLNTVNFVFDGIIKNLGFAAGAIAAGGVWGAALKSLPLVSRLFATGRGAEALVASEEAIAAGKATETFGRLKSLSDKFLGGYSAMNPAGRAVVAGLSTIGEASFEALGAINAFRQEKIDEYRAANGFDPVGEDLDRINQAADQVGNWTMGLNAALLTATQYIQLPRLLGSSYSNEKPLMDEVIAKTKGLVRDETGNLVRRPLTKAGKILGGLDRARPYLFSSSEAFEEASQYAVQVGTDHYFNRKYRQGDAEFLDSLGFAIGETATSDEGQESAFIGGVSGAWTMARGTWMKRSAIQRNTAAAIEDINKTKMSDFTQATLDSLKMGVSLQIDKENHTLNGDVLEVKDVEKDMIITYLSPRLKYDRYDLVKEDIATYKTLAASPEGFQQLKDEGKALPTDTSQAFLARLNSFERTAENMHSLYQSLNLRYAGILDKDGARVYDMNLMDRMVYAATKIADYDERIPQLTENLGHLALDIPALLEEARTGGKELYDKAVTRVESLTNLNADEKQTLITNLAHARELTARRDKFLKEYDDMKLNPLKHKETEKERELKEETPTGTIKVKTKDGEEELELGVVYMLGQDTEVDEQGNEYITFPQLTILGQNEDGTIKIKGSNGVIKDISPEKLESYKLGKRDDVMKSKKGMYFYDHRNTIFEYNFGKDKGGKKPGRLGWSPKDGKLLFRYKDAKGKPQTKVITSKMLVPQGEYKTALLTPVGQVSPVQKKSHDALVKEAQEEAEKELSSLREERLTILKELTDAHSKRIETISKKIEINKEQIAKIDEDFVNLGVKEGKAGAKKAFATFTKAINKLSNMREKLSEENTKLLIEKEELDMNYSYFKEITDDIAKMDFDEFTKQVQDLKALAKSTNDTLTQLKDTLSLLDKAIAKTIDYVRSLWDRFESKHGLSPTGVPWSEYITQNEDFLNFANPEFRDQLQWVTDTTSDIEEFDQLSINEDRVKEIREQIKEVEKALTPMQKEYAIKKNIYDKFKKALAAREGKKAAIEAFEANKKLHSQLFISQDAHGKKSGIINPPPNSRGEKGDSKRKTFNNLASTMDSSFDDPKGDSPERRRHWAFLSNFKDLPEEKRKNMRVIAVTQNNEKYLGLEGLTAYKMGQGTHTSPDDGFIATVYAEKDGNTYHFVDQDGNRISQIGKATDIQQIVYSTLATTALKGAWGDRYVTRDSDVGSPADYMNAWRETRAEILNTPSEKGTHVYQFDISRGIEQENKVDGKNEENPVIGTLARKEDLNKPLLEVVTTGTIQHRGVILKFPIGKVVLMNEDTVQFVNNRNFTKEEVPVIFDVIREIARRSQELVKAGKPGGLDAEGINFLQGIIHWGSPIDKDGNRKKPARNQIWIESNSGHIFFGENEVGVPFFPEALDEQKATVMAFLEGMYNNVNNHKLKPENRKLPFTEITGVKDGVYKTRQWKTYQHFLLSDTYDLTDEDKSPLKGQKRPSPHLTTTVRKRMDKNDVNYVQKYITLKHKDDGTALKLDVVDTRKKPQAPTQEETTSSAPTTPTQEAAAPITKIGNYEVGKQNTFKSGAGKMLKFKLTLNPETGEPIVDMVMDKEFKEAIALLAPKAEKMARELGEIDEAELATMDDEEIATMLIRSTIKSDIINKLKEKDTVEDKTSKKPTKAKEKEKEKEKDKPPAPVASSTYELKGGKYVHTTGQGKKISFTVKMSDEGIPMVTLIRDKELTSAIAALAPNAEAQARTIPDIDKDELDQMDDEEIAEMLIRGVITDSFKKSMAPQAPKATVVEGPAVERDTEGVSEADVLAMLKDAKGKVAKKRDSYRLAIDNVIAQQRENWGEVEAWLKENLPNIPLHRLETLISTTDGGRAWGVFRDAALYVYEGSEVGTTFHEAFHAVWSMFATPSQREGMINEFRGRKGSFLDRPTQVEVAYKDASIQQIKEQLAEEFREFKLEGKPRVPSNFIVRFFRDLIQTIRDMIFGTKAEEFFKKIDTGYYKNYPVNIDHINPSDEDYRLVIDRWSAQVQKEVMDGIFTSFMSNLFNPETGISIVELEEGGVSSKEIYDAVYQELEEEYTVNMRDVYAQAITDNPKHEVELARTYKKYLDLWTDIKNNWSKLVNENNEKLLAWGIVNEQSETEVESVEGDPSENINHEDRQGRSDDYLRDVMKIDSKKNAATSVKLLLASLVQTEERVIKSSSLTTFGAKAALDKPTDPKVSSVGLHIPVRFAKTFNHLMHTASGARTLDKMIMRVGELAKNYPDYVRLFTRLKGSLQTGKIDYSDPNLTLEDWKLLSKFYNVFAKQKPQALIQVIGEDGLSYTQNANSAEAATTIVNSWINSMKTSYKEKTSAIIFNTALKTFAVDPDKLPEIPRSPEQVLAALKSIGIDIPKAKYESFPAPILDQFNGAVSSILYQLRKEPNIITVEGKTLAITGPLNHLAEIMVKAEGDFSESTFFNTEREKVQAHVQHNYASLFVMDFNEVGSLDELYILHPQLEDVWSQDSEILKKGGEFFMEDGKRIANAPLNLGYIDGTVNKLKKNKQTARLSYIERVRQEFNENLQGRYFGLVPADSKTEWLFSSGNFISYSETHNNLVYDKIYTRFLSYLSTEIKLAQASQERGINVNMEDKGNNLRFFKDILNPEQLKDIQQLIDSLADDDTIQAYLGEEKNYTPIRASIISFIKAEADKTKELMQDFNEIELHESAEFWTFRNLNGDFRSNNNIGFKLTDEVIDKIMLMRTVNYMVANTELHKVLFGDPALIKDHTKRYKSFFSGTETPVHDSPEYDQWHTEHFNYAGNVKLEEGDMGYREFKNYLKTATLEDIYSDGEIYEGAKEADAQSWMLGEAYRELLLKHGKWTDAMETQFQYEMAWTRNYLDQYENDDLRDHDIALLEKGDPEAAVFPIIKPKGSGQKLDTTYLNLYLDKTSAYPMFLRHIVQASPNSNLQKMYIKMWNNEIDYVIVESGRKVGAQKLHKIYNEDGSFNDEDFEEESIVDIPFRNYGIQVETLSSKYSQTLGSQGTKLATMDLMQGGVPLDFQPEEKDFKKRMKAWRDLDEEGKMQSPIYQKVRKNQELLEQLAQDGYDRLLKKLGITDNGRSFSAKDKTKIYNYIRTELRRRDVDENTIDGITLNADGELSFPIEANPKYVQIKNILYSLVEKNIGSPKVNGGPKTMLSSTMWESGSREMREGRMRISQLLKFYSKDNPYIEVMLPHWFKTQMQRRGITGDDATLLRKLKDSGILEGIGFRIPTQALSSIDAFRVVGFLPQAMGDTVVVPAELTVKAGSDFDVDKLNTYLKNIEIDKDGNIVPIVYKGSKEATMKFYGKKFDDLLKKRKTNAANFLDAVMFAVEGEGNEQNFKRHEKLLKAILTAKTPEEAKASLEKLSDEQLQSSLRERYINQMYSKSLENAYFESLQELITLPENFDRLTSQNTDKTLKGLRDDLQKLMTPEKELANLKKKNNFSLLLSPSYMSVTRHNFMVGKGGVGIAAIQQTGHSLNQRSPIYVNTDIISTLSEEDKLVFGDGSIKLLHNTIEVDGKSYPSLSHIKDRAGKYISDKISEYINGYVDIAKDAFIIEIGANTNVASTFMFLEKIGVPTRHVVMFMNQPSIREFLKELSIKGWSTVNIPSLVNEVIQSKFGGETPANFDTLPTANFEENIRQYYQERGNKPFTQEQNQEQAAILHEFQKYALMAQHLGEVMRGSSYDTVRYSDSNQHLFKEQQTELARQGNIISSVDSLLNNSFIGKRRTLLGRSIDAIAQAIPMKLSSPFIRSIIDPIKRIYGQRKMFLSEKTRLDIAKKIELSFFDYLVQVTKGQEDKVLTDTLERLMIDQEKAIAYTLSGIKKGLVQKEFSHLADNPIIQELEASPRVRPGGPKNIILKNKDNDKPTSDMYTSALRELKNNALTAGLYKNLIAVSLLQSGVGKTFYSFGHLIPVEDYQEIISPVLEGIEDNEALLNFRQNHAFFRNNWHDDDIVPSVDPRWDDVEYNGIPQGMYIDDDFLIYQRSWLYKSVPLHIRKMEGVTSVMDFVGIHSIYGRGAHLSPVIKVPKKGVNPETGLEYTSRQIAIMRQAGNFSYQDVALYSRVEDTNGDPLTVLDDKGQKVYIYKAINAWGDGPYAQEYYTDSRQSRYDNGSRKVTELDDKLIMRAYRHGIGLKDEAPTPPATTNTPQTNGFEDFKNSLKREDCDGV